MRWLSFRSLTVQLTVLFSLASSTVLLSLCFFIFISIDNHFVAEDKDTLFRRLSHLQHTLAAVQTQKDKEILQRQLTLEFTEHHGVIVVLKNAQGQVLFPDNQPALQIQEPKATTEKEDFEPFIWRNSAGAYRVITGKFTSPLNEWASGTILVGMEISHHEAFIQSFFWSLLASLLLAVIFVSILGWMATKRGLTPLRWLIASASKITANRLNRRLPLDETPLELEDLTNTLNDMFARLEESFKRLSDFSSDIAHELRTPISNLKLQTQVILSRPRTADEYRDVLSSNAEELDRMARMVSDMLFLAKADHGLMVPSKEHLALDSEIKSLFEFYAILAETNGMQLDMTGSGMVLGDRAMLRRAFGNLLSNAVIHGEENSKISVTINQVDNSYVILTFTNYASALKPEHLTHMFDRFYRVDSARSETGSGAGLGLAITQSIIRAHGGDIQVKTENGAIHFIVRLQIKDQNI